MAFVGGVVHNLPMNVPTSELSWVGLQQCCMKLFVRMSKLCDYEMYG